MARRTAGGAQRSAAESTPERPPRRQVFRIPRLADRAGRWPGRVRRQSVPTRQQSRGRERRAAIARAALDARPRSLSGGDLTKVCDGPFETLAQGHARLPAELTPGAPDIRA